MTDEQIRLTQYSHGAGCGCKLSPAVLDRVLAGQHTSPHAALLVGNDARDDAGAYDLGDGRVLLTTTDFFMPIVDDPFEFGAIAAANAISDIYAMGGTPMMALAILGWPVEVLPPEVAGRVIEGARATCDRAGVALAGGHSIESPEPIFGLSVNGLVPRERLKRNGTAQVGDVLFLTKPLGVGILSTAEKRELLREQDRGLAAASMMKLNDVGAALGQIDGVTAMTDVTGFGLLGHLGEMCAARLGASIRLDAIEQLTDLDFYLERESIPGGSRRNWASYSGSVAGDLTDRARWILADPQTSGGLLVAVSPDDVATVQRALVEHGLERHTQPIGSLIVGTRIEVEERAT